MIVVLANYLIFKVAAIHVESRMVLKRSRCTVDMLNQIFYDKTVDGGKTSGVLAFQPNRHIVVLKLTTWHQFNIQKLYFHFHRV